MRRRRGRETSRLEGDEGARQLMTIAAELVAVGSSSLRPGAARGAGCRLVLFVQLFTYWANDSIRENTAEYSNPFAIR